MTTAALWQPPRIAQAPRFDAFWNALVSYVDVPLPLRNKVTAQVSLAAAPPPDRHAMNLSFETGTRLYAVPIAFPFQALVGADLAIEDLPLLPPVLCEAIEEGIVAILAMIAPETDEGHLALDESGPFATFPATPPEELRWFRVILAGLVQENAAFDVGVTLDGLAAIFGLDVSPRQVWPGLKTRLLRDVDITIGRVSVPTDTLRTLGAGTIIVLDRTLDPAFFQLRMGATRFDFKASGQTWLCASVVDIDRERDERDQMTLTPTTSSTDPGGAEGHGGVDLGLLTVAIDLDLGRVSVPLSEIETWQPGSLVALGMVPAADAVEVTLRVNGQAIGRGDLVQIDNRLAVRVTQLTLRG